LHETGLELDNLIPSENENGLITRLVLYKAIEEEVFIMEEIDEIGPFLACAHRAQGALWLCRSVMYCSRRRPLGPVTASASDVIGNILRIKDSISAGLL